MSELNARCLESFPVWLRSLSQDTQDLAALAADESQDESIRRIAAAAVNYLFKSLDLIPDGIEDLGFMDDAFVLRVASAHAAEQGASGELIERLSPDATLIREFLSDDYDRLDRFVRGLPGATVRGRSVDALMNDQTTRAEWLGDLRGWAESYQAPSFPPEEKNLIKLKAFMKTKLPVQGAGGLATRTS